MEDGWSHAGQPWEMSYVSIGTPCPSLLLGCAEQPSYAALRGAGELSLVPLPLSASHGPGVTNYSKAGGVWQEQLHWHVQTGCVGQSCRAGMICAPEPLSQRRAGCAAADSS